MKISRRIGKSILSIVLALAMTAQLPITAFAGNGVLEETEVVSVQVADPELSENLALGDFLWPDADGRYYVTVPDVTTGGLYMLFVVAGRIEMTDSLESDEIVSNIIYVDQKKATGATVSFDGFKPSREANATVIVSGQGMDPHIVGYISRDYFSVNRYCDEEGVTVIDSYTCPAESSFGAVREMLPKSAMAEIVSDYTERVFAPVTLLWDCEELFVAERGRTYVFTADVTLTDSEAFPVGIENILTPLSANVTVADENAEAVSLSVSVKPSVYSIGDAISPEEISVKAVYDDGTVRPVTDWTSNLEELSGDTAGEKLLTVSYKGLSASVKLYVKAADEDTCEIRFDTMGGSLVPSVAVARNSTLTSLPEAPVKNGFRFIGWYTDKQCSQPFVLTASISEDLTLYAGWLNSLAAYPDKLLVTLDTNAVSTAEPLTDASIHVSVHYSDDYEAEVYEYSTNLSELNQREAGTKTLIVAANVDGIPLSAEVNFYVIDLENTAAYVVSFDTGIETETIENQYVLAGMTATEPEIPVRGGYVFGGWYNGKSKWDFGKKVTSDMTLTAKWVNGELIGDESNNFYVYVENNLSYSYTGSAIKPTPVVMDNHLNVLKKDKDYTISYLNNKEVSTPGLYASYTVTGKGNYSGSVTRTFIINAKDINDGVSIKLAESYAYKTSGVSPVPTLKLGKTTLKKAVDYTYSYQKLAYKGASEGASADLPLTESGWYRVTITGIRSFTGTKTIDVCIGKKNTVNLSSAKITVAKKGQSVAYTGMPITIDDYVKVTAKVGKKNVTLSPDDDYVLEYQEDHTNPGKITVTARAKESSENCYGSKTFSFKITGLKMADAKISLLTNSIVYDGKLHNNNLSKVSVKVTKSNKAMINRISGGSYAVNSYYELAEGRDYSVTYTGGLNAGTAKVTVTGLGSFSGSKTASFTIAARSLTDSSVCVSISSAEVKKAGAQPAVEISYSNGSSVMTLRSGIDYKVKCSNNTAVTAAAKIEITGAGNFKGKIKKTFAVTAKSLLGSDITIQADSILPGNKVGAGGVYKPSIVVKDGSKALKAGTDYTVDYSGCVTYEDLASVDYLEGYVVVKGTGKNYTGAVRTYYITTKQTLANARITVAGQIYTGKPITFDGSKSADLAAFTAVYGEGETARELLLGRDFKVIAYSKNTAIGTATITLQGIGNYAGTKKVTFAITKCPLH